MNEEVSALIEGLDYDWQRDLARQLRDTVHQVIPGVTERVQYRKPHFLKNGKYVAVISPSKVAVNFTIFNTGDLEVPEGFDGPAERKTTQIREGQTPDFDLLSDLLSRAASGL